MAYPFSDTSGIYEALGIYDRSRSRLIFSNITPPLASYRGYEVVEIGRYNTVLAAYSRYKKEWSTNQTAAITTPEISLIGDVGTNSHVQIYFKVYAEGNWVWLLKDDGNPVTGFDIVNYSSPTITEFSIVRADSSGNPLANGTYLKYTLRCDLSAVGSNTADVKLKYRVKGATTWNETALLTDVTAINQIGVTLSSPTFISENGHDIVVEITDNLSNKAVATRELQSSATKLLYFDKAGHRIGIGAKNTVDNSMLVGMDTTFVEDVTFEKAPTMSAEVAAALLQTLVGAGGIWTKTNYMVKTGSVVASSSGVTVTFAGDLFPGVPFVTVVSRTSSPVAVAATSITETSVIVRAASSSTVGWKAEYWG